MLNSSFFPLLFQKGQDLTFREVRSNNNKLKQGKTRTIEKGYNKHNWLLKYEGLLRFTFILLFIDFKSEMDDENLLNNVLKIFYF